MLITPGSGFEPHKTLLSSRNSSGTSELVLRILLISLWTLCVGTGKFLGQLTFYAGY